MSGQEIDRVNQQIFFEHTETGEQLTKLDKAEGVNIPAEGEEITLADVEFENTEDLARELNKDDETYLVQSIDRRFARAKHTESDPPSVFQFSLITVFVEESD